MIDVEKAMEILLAHRMDLGTEKIPLSDSLHRVLKEDWRADRDLPPYDRVTMDGIAIQYEQFAKGQRSFKIEAVAAAGMEQLHLQNAEHCMEVMTGASLPKQVDTVIRYEDLDIQNEVATITIDDIEPAQNVHFRGEDRKAGELIVPINTRISPAEIGLGASLGKAQIEVAKLPRIIVVSTGDELVPINQQPGPHQIRRSNVYRLITTLHAYHIEADEDHLMDEPDEIRQKLLQYLNSYDVVILSGGVSKGKFDYLPQILDELGVTKLFHRIRQKPGKPFWFGQYQQRCTIFALPGNPISSFLCMQRYFLPWLDLSQQGKIAERPYAQLTAPVQFKPDLTYFLEVKISYTPQGQLLATPKKGSGSGDLANLVDADAFIELPRGKERYEAGEVHPIYWYRR